LEKIKTIIGLLPEPAATAFAVAGLMGLRQGEIQACCARTTRTARYLFLDPSGMVEGTTQRLAKGVLRFP